MNIYNFLIIVNKNTIIYFAIKKKKSVADICLLA